MRITEKLLKHAENLLEMIFDSALSADLVAQGYLRKNRELGQGDRSFIANVIFAVLRHRRSLEARCYGEINPRRLLLVALCRERGVALEQIGHLISEAEQKWLEEAKTMGDEKLTTAERLELPDLIYEKLLAQYGEEDSAKIAVALNEVAPLVLRVNSLKTDRESALKRLNDDGIIAEPCRYSPLGIRIKSKLSLTKHPLFVEGCVEVQDEGSQLLCYLVQPKRDEMVADFCAGAGGKTLMLGAMMRAKGRLYAFDIDEKRLAKMKPRLDRSGLKNVQSILLDSEVEPKIVRLGNKMDRVLVDAPCSGVGTLRRNPGLKWQYTAEIQEEISQVQTNILLAAASLVKEGGRLVYSTCSLLEDENEAIVEKFLEARPEFVLLSAKDELAKKGIAVELDDACGDKLRLMPHLHNTDGFFAAVMVRR